MHPPGLFQLLVILLILVVLFGRGRISEFMGDVGKGVKNFRRTLADDEEPAPPLRVDGPAVDSTLAEAAGNPQPAADQIHK